jgi:hypothetical protein
MKAMRQLRVLASIEDEPLAREVVIPAARV